MNELLTIFEHEKPIIDTAEVLSELEDFAIRDVVDIYSLPVELLASFGGLGRDGAQRLQQFVLERLLGPLGLMDTHLLNGDDNSVQEVTAEGVVVPVVAECHDRTGSVRVRSLSLGLPPSLRYPSPSQTTRCITRLA